jgi:hypothetical protein
MRYWLRFGPVLAAAAVLQAQAQSPELSLLDKVKARAVQNLNGLPNYTCTESIQRLVHAAREKRFRHWDTVRINVAYVGGKELFGLPGTGRVDQSNYEELVRGPMGNGEFALFLSGIFVEERAQIGEFHKANLDRRPAFRFDYQVPLARSGFRIKSGAGDAIVGYSGTFWVARDSLDLMRLIVSGDNLPLSLAIVSDVSTTDYTPTRIGGSLFLLPRDSTFQAKDKFGEEVRNMITFERCREFVGESTLKFGDALPPSNK